MKLFHAFPRPSHQTDAAGRAVRAAPTLEDREKGLQILELILTHGLLCTPENFKLYPNYNTANAEKKVFLRANKHHDEIVQSRACFTLMDTQELTKEYELSRKPDARYAAHVDLFGEFAIGLDPLEARELGIMPTVYYYKHDKRIDSEKMAGLGSQIIERLDEIRGLFSVLSYIEARADAGKDAPVLPSEEQLKSLGISVRHQKAIEGELEKLNVENASMIFRLLNTDRVPAWNLVDFVEIMLSLYQTTDSTIEDAPLAFFHQREWRLVHHMMKGLVWFGLSEHVAGRDSMAQYFTYSRKQIEDFLRGVFSRKVLEKEKEEERKKYAAWFLKHSWVLAGTENLHFRDFVREIVVPEGYYEKVRRIVDNLPFDSKPIITTLPPRWRIVTENGAPRVVLN